MNGDPATTKFQPRRGNSEGGHRLLQAYNGSDTINNHASDHAAVIPPEEAEIAPCPVAQSMEELASATTNPSFISSPQIGVGYGD